MRSELNQLHEYFRTCRNVAAFLGYSLRAYMEIRRRVLKGAPLTKRVQVLIRHKLSELAEKLKSNSQKGVASVTNHIKSTSSNNGGAGFQKEFNKTIRRTQSMLRAGKSRKDVHEFLTNAGRITMSYSRFCGLVVRELENDPHFLTDPPVKPESRRKGAASMPRTPRR